jgi:T4 gene Gp59 loader of gp41 DNA helicase
VDGFKVWKLYMAVKLHFTTNSYNVFNNRGHVKGARDTFYARNDRFIFEKLARKFPTERDIIQYFVANFAYGNQEVVYEPSTGDSNLITWNKRKQSISQVFESDLHTILLHLEKNGMTEKHLYEGNPPELFKLYLGGYITVETMVILNSFVDYLTTLKLQLNLLWAEECRIIDKCKGFVKFDKDRLLQVYHKFKQEIVEL